MDETLLANFMVFHDLVREEHYDLWVGDEAWELDYYLHENPEHKQAAYVWLTDFVGDPDAIAAEIGRAVDYRPVETDGATRAASLIAELV
jgi:hypothetical protein